MKERLLSSVIYFSLLLCILLINNKIVDSILITLVSVISMHEYIKCFRQKGYHPISAIGYISCFGIFLMGINIDYYTKMLMLRIFVPAILITMFLYIIIKNLDITVIDIAITLLSIVYIPFLFSFVKLILSMEYGRVYIWLVLLGAFMSDIFGYLIGRRFGKHKLCPKISPKKSKEGATAGVIGVIISYVIFTIVANRIFGMNINMVVMIVASVVISIAGQFGDLAASSIKRFCGVKDFGSIMPGHGGILDRCDSMLFVAPLVYILLKLFIL